MVVLFTNLRFMAFQVRYLVLFLLFSVIDGFKFSMESLHKNFQLMLEFLEAPFLVLHFSYNTLMIFLTLLYVILLSMRMIIISILSVIRDLIRGNNLNWLLNLNLIYETLWTGVRHLALFLLFSIIGSFELLWVENLHNNFQLMLEFFETSFLILHFSYHALTIFLKMLSLILLSMQMILLTIVLVIRHLICGNNLKLLVDFNARKTQQVLLDQFNNNDSVDVNWMALFSRKNHLLRCWS